MVRDTEAGWWAVHLAEPLRTRRSALRRGRATHRTAARTATLPWTIGRPRNLRIGTSTVTPTLAHAVIGSVAQRRAGPTPRRASEAWLGGPERTMGAGAPCPSARNTSGASEAGVPCNEVLLPLPISRAKPRSIRMPYPAESMATFSTFTSRWATCAAWSPSSASATQPM